MSVSLMLRGAEREARVWARLWRAGAFSVFVAPVLMLVALGIGLGGLVDDDRRELEGLEYFAFVTPGLLVATAMQTAAGYSLWPVMAGNRWLGFHHAQVSSPLSARDVYGGMVLWTIAKTAMQASVVLAAGAALGGVSSWWGLAVVPIAAFTALAFSAPLTAFAATQDSDAAFEVIIRVGVQPLFLFSGTLFSVDQLPAALRIVTQVFPLWHGVELARSATTGSADIAPIFGHVAVLALYASVGWWWGGRTFPRKLTA